VELACPDAFGAVTVIGEDALDAGAAVCARRADGNRATKLRDSAIRRNIIKTPFDDGELACERRLCEPYD
jgi:hypothetical protein